MNTVARRRSVDIHRLVPFGSIYCNVESEARCEVARHRLAGLVFGFRTSWKDSKRSRNFFGQWQRYGDDCWLSEAEGFIGANLLD